MKVKICGIKSLEIAKFSIDNGADLIGLNFSPISIRQIDLKIADEIYSGLSKMNEEKKLVALFFKTEKNIINQILTSFNFNYVQIIHSDSIVDRNDFKEKKIIQYSVQNELNDSDLIQFEDDVLILDSNSKNLGGGTGETFNWDLVKNIKRDYFLAGGLNPKNVLLAKEKLNPYGVDVASGVEMEKGVKDKNLVKEFLINAKRN